MKKGQALTAVLFILPLSTVVLAITAEDAWDTAAWVGTFELAGQANMNIWESRFESNQSLLIKYYCDY